MEDMKRRTGILGVLIAILAIGIGYAVVSAIPLEIKGTGTVSSNPNGFVVKFKEVASKIGDGTLNASISDDTHATISVSGLTESGQKATFVYTVLNASEEMNYAANLTTPTVEVEKSEYFDVTAVVNNPTTIKQNETTTVTVVVTAKKTPVGDDVTSNITVTLNAEAVEA